MNTARISIIAALGKTSRAIGNNNQLLWHIPEDLRHFKALTLGHPVVMGSKTFASIGKPLPGRPNIVITDDATFAHNDVYVCHSIDEALDKALSLDEVEIFIIGGGSIYAQTISLADRLYLTVVDSDTEGDVLFPEYTSLPFTVVERIPKNHGALAFEFVTLDKAR